MFQPKARVRYVPTSGPAKPALILHRVGDLDAYQIRLACGRKLTVPSTQLQPKGA